MLKKILWLIFIRGFEGGYGRPRRGGRKSIKQENVFVEKLKKYGEGANILFQSGIR